MLARAAIVAVLASVYSSAAPIPVPLGATPGLRAARSRCYDALSFEVISYGAADSSPPRCLSSAGCPVGSLCLNKAEADRLRTIATVGRSSSSSSTSAVTVSSSTSSSSSSSPAPNGDSSPEIVDEAEQGDAATNTPGINGHGDVDVVRVTAAPAADDNDGDQGGGAASQNIMILSALAAFLAVLCIGCLSIVFARAHYGKRHAEISGAGVNVVESEGGSAALADSFKKTAHSRITARHSTGVGARPTRRISISKPKQSKIKTRSHTTGSKPVKPWSFELAPNGAVPLDGLLNTRQGSGFRFKTQISLNAEELGDGRFAMHVAEVRKQNPFLELTSADGYAWDDIDGRYNPGPKESSTDNLSIPEGER